MPQPRKVYAPTKEKDFEQVLTHLFKTEFGFLGGPSVIKLMVDRIQDLVEMYYPPKERLRMGEMLWFAVAEDEKRGPSRGIKELRIVPIKLPLVTPSDIQAYIDGKRQHDIVKQVVARLFKESYAQGGVLAEHDVALILHRDTNFISDLFREYISDEGEILPSRGIVHDLGGAMTHKAIIVGEYLEGREAPEISRRTKHTINAVDRYIKHANQIRTALKNGVPRKEIPQVTGLSGRLVEVYVSLLEKIAESQKKEERNLCAKPGRN